MKGTNELYIYSQSADPRFGSEHAASWSKIKELAKYRRITLFCFDWNGSAQALKKEINKYRLPIKVIPLKLTNKRILHKYPIFILTVHYHNFIAYRTIKKHLDNNGASSIIQIGYTSFLFVNYFLLLLNLPVFYGPLSSFFLTDLKKAKNWSGSFKFLAFSLAYNVLVYFARFFFKQIIARSKNSFIFAATADDQKWLTSNSIECLHVRDTSIEKNNETIVKYTKAIGSSSRDIDVILVGTLIPRKGFTYLINQLKELTEARKIKSLNVVVVGGGGQYDRLYNSSSKFLNIHMAGAVSKTRVKEFLCRSKMLVIPSIREANTSVLFEAYECGTIVCATDIPGLRDNVPDEFILTFDNYIHDLNRIMNSTNTFDNVLLDSNPEYFLKHQVNSILQRIENC